MANQFKSADLRLKTRGLFEKVAESNDRVSIERGGEHFCDAISRDRFREELGAFPPAIEVDATFFRHNMSLVLILAHCGQPFLVERFGEKIVVVAPTVHENAETEAVVATVRRNVTGNRPKQLVNEPNLAEISAKMDRILSVLIAAPASKSKRRKRKRNGKGADYSEI